MTSRRVHVVCPKTGDDPWISLGNAWLVRSPGQVHLSWRCPCQEDHDLAMPLSDQAVTVLRAEYALLVDVSSDREFIDSARNPQHPRLTVTDASQFSDALWLDHAGDVIAGLPAGLVEAVQADLQGKALARRSLDAAISRTRASLAKMRSRSSG